MDSGSVPRLNVTRCCDCKCVCSLINGSHSDVWLRSVKRKFDEIKEGDGVIYISDSDSSFVARIGVENECHALRERVQSQQQSIYDLYLELEEERSASSSAANEAMSMILRLQREKAVVQMEARQFKSLVEEKMAHDQNELWALQDVLYKREQAIQSLTHEVCAYKYRLMSYGFSESGEEVEGGRHHDHNNMSDNFNSVPLFPDCDYPPLKCNVGGLVISETHNEVIDIDKYAFGEAPWDLHNLKTLDHRISELEGASTNNNLNVDFNENVLEKVVVNHCPRHTGHSSKVSNGGLNSQNGFSRKLVPDSPSESPRIDTFQNTECVSHTVDDYSNLKNTDDISQSSEDVGDRVYTIDSIHNSIQTSNVIERKGSPGIGEDGVTTPKSSLEDPYLKNLFIRLQTLEADRESMKQALISMRTQKAELALYKEIAQQIRKEAASQRKLHVTKAPFLQRFSLMPVLKWILSVLWGKKARKNRFGVTAGNVGLLMLLEKGSHMRKWRCSPTIKSI